MWIQSHVGSTGNESVDQLAKNADGMLFQNRIQNPLTGNVEKNGQRQ
jgi:ribonuclease HI